MDELIKALTRAATAVAVYYEKESGMTGKDVADGAAAAPEVKTHKGRRAKAETRGQDNVPGEPETQRPAPAFDPMMDMGGAAQPAAAPAATGMTEAESTVKVQEANKALVKAFPTKQGDGMPEGFHKAKALLAEFGVARTTDLVHAQRVSYIAKIDALIGAAAV